MLNPATEKLVISNYFASYTYLYAQHNFYLDDDVVSKVVFYTMGGNPYIRYIPATQKLYTFFTLNGLTPSSTITLNAAFYDAMASDPSLVEAKKGINLSDTLTFTTATPPTITDIDVVATAVDVGVSDPTINLTLSGSAQTITIQAQKVGNTEWEPVYNGGFSTSVSMILPIGQYKFRVSGKFMLPDGITVDTSAFAQYPSIVDVRYLAIPPTTPSNLVFATARIKDGVERYDTKVSWTWTRGTGAASREFLLQYVPTSEYNSTGWAKASIINMASAHSAIITGFPYNKEYTFRVGVTSWGQDTVWSSSAKYIVNSSTVFDQSITTVSGCEIGYYGIRAYYLENSTYKQSFRLDAATGALAIGALSDQGVAPFTFDPVSKVLNVDGKVITKDINAANFILTNLGSGSPKLYSQEKSSYGSSNSGVYMGRAANGKMQFDLGNSVAYMRFDGDNLRLSKDVIVGTPMGDSTLGGLAPRGSGMFAVAVNGLGAWNDYYANNFFASNYGSGPLKYDVITEYNTSNPTIAFTRMWNGSAWVAPSLTVHGDMIVNGTVKAQALVASDAFFAQAGINRIYDRAAALSGAPETNYKMKIDLANGLIHIR